jgi:hypothetical protein
MKGEKEKYMHALTSPGGVGEARGVGAWRVHEWSVEIWLKASHVCDFLLSFIIATSQCLIHFNRDKPSRLRDAVILDGSSL